jgi:hypothetical protein
MANTFHIGDRVQMKGSPQFNGRITRISSDGFAQLSSNLRIHVDELETKKRAKAGTALANWADKTAAMPDSNGKFQRVPKTIGKVPKW